MGPLAVFVSRNSKHPFTTVDRMGKRALEGGFPLPENPQRSILLSH